VVTLFTVPNGVFTGENIIEKQLGSDII